MQLAEVFRLGIVTPVTEETNSQLKNGSINGLVEVKFLPLTQQDFYLIWESGLFVEINKLLDLKIGEYEDTCIDATFLEICLGIVQKYFSGNKNEHLSTLLKSIYDAFFFGSQSRMPVYLIF